MSHPIRWAIATAAAACLATTAAAPRTVFAQGEVTRILTASADDVAKQLGDLTQAAARNASDGVAWRDLGIAQCRLGRYAEAAETFAHAAENLDDDFYLRVYEAVNAEMLGDYAAAADAYGKAAQIDTKLSEHLVQRAGNLRARSLVAPADPDGSFADGPNTLALLPPVDLGGDAADLTPVLGAVLTLALGQASGMAVLSPSDTERWLAADGRAVADFDDPGSRDRVARNLARKGVEAVLACTFLHMPTGELHFRFALIGVSDAGAAETQAIPAEVGAKGQELVPLRASASALWAAMGVTGAPDQPEIPASLAAARSYSEGLQQLRDGKTKPASASFCEAKQLAPDVTRFASLCEQMSKVQVDDDPLASSFEKPLELVADAVRDLAKRQKRSDRRYDDL